MPKEIEKRIVYLFQRYFNNEATSVEQEDLVNWILQEEHRPQVEELLRKAWVRLNGEEEIFSKEQSDRILQHILEKNTEEEIAPQKKTHLKRWLAVAATVLALLSTGYFIFFFNSSEKEYTYNTKQIENDVLPGKNQAVLVLANGSTIQLSDKKTGTIATQGKTNIVKIKNGQLAYNKDINWKENRKLVQYNTLRTPRGGQYQLTLPDGSTVWLNAASSLKYPTTFNGKNRLVELTGEAFFDIAQNKDKPFKVIANGMEVNVLGTHFNMNTYEDNPDLITTLVEGAISVGGREGKNILKPGQKADIDKHSGKMEVSKANIDKIVAWKNGVFYFKGDDMGYIMRRIARWYDVKVSYKGEIPSGHYTGIISRNTNLSQVLKVLELSGVHFEIKGHQIIVG